MMYKNNLAVAIKVNGRVLREQGDIVKLPFGSEYSILLKNLNPVRVQFKLQIDGQEATDNTWIVIPANSSVEMERFIKNSNWEQGNKFKFIERSAEVEQHRGIGVEDGLVRIEYKKEVAQTISFYSSPYTGNISFDRCQGYHSGTMPRGQSRGGPCQPDYTTTTTTVVPNTTTTGALNTGNINQQQQVFNSFCDSFAVAGGGAAAARIPEPETSEAGITVEGSKSNQRFTNAAWFATESETHVMVMHLKGQVAGQPVTAPVTVEKKLVCTSCGRANKSNAHFCNKCGTSLVSYA